MRLVPRVDVRHKSHPSRGAWIEMHIEPSAILDVESHPSRGAWIEIDIVVLSEHFRVVAPLTGCVD